MKKNSLLKNFLLEKEVSVEQYLSHGYTHNEKKTKDRKVTRHPDRNMIKM